MDTYRVKLPKADVEALRRLARHRSFLNDANVTWQQLLRESIGRMLAAEQVPEGRAS